MKTRIVSVLMLMGVYSMTLFAGPVKAEKFKVAGNCGMCKARIEKATKSVSGVTEADWNRETKMIEVAFNAAGTDIHKVHEAIAKAGHDTELVRADDKAYASLPGCCKYERMVIKSSDAADTAHGSNMDHKR